MEYLNCGSLADMLDRIEGNLSEKQITLILYKVVQGIKYLHKISRIHRDIKAANLLVNSSGDVKLTDFGISAQIVSADSVRNTSIGSPYWMAPEIIEEKGHNNKVDIWSLGITCIELAEKKPPHSDKTPIRALFAITTNPPPRFSKPDNYSSLLNDFIELCLNKEPKQRPSAEELLKHELFFKENLSKDSLLADMFEKYPIDLQACRDKYGSFTGPWNIMGLSGSNRDSSRRSSRKRDKEKEKEKDQDKEEEEKSKSKDGSSSDKKKRRKKHTSRQ
eukprot:TRINITY_DN3720_c0_g1_i4.p1 TRINITY_DN3720_c0_g1~~TRINITY_DN3720_c0_g1_i4.p1  ORF type:complete len:276 (-),score=58.45 TRINITY_DN3720_c0_g1_i4:92-919(-)